MNQGVLDDLGFSYEIVRSKRKSAAIHVKANMVEVRIPYFVDDQWVLAFLSSKASWIQSKLAQQAKHAQMLPVIESGAKLLWLGEPLTLVFAADSKGVAIHDGQITLEARDQAQAIAQLQAYFKQQARVYMVTRTQAIAETFELDHLLQDVRFRKTKTKWGHCTFKGVIQYNWLIMGAPEPVIEYLMCHELSHLTHPNHSAAFWREVQRLCPDYKQNQAWLKHNSSAISWC